MSTSNRHLTRPRRIDDALSQLVDSLTPALPISAVQNDDDYSDPEDALAAAEEQRHQTYLDRAWRVLDSHANTNAGDHAGSPAGLGGRRASFAVSENINNAPDLIKRKLRRENASPDKAVRFSNLYSRLLTQPVLSQKWGILYLLYRLSRSDDSAEGREGSRSPLMDEGHLQHMLGPSNAHPRRDTATRGLESDDDGPALSSSASQVPTRLERQSSLRHGWQGTDQAERGSTERTSESRANRASHSNTEMNSCPDEDRGSVSTAKPSTKAPTIHTRPAESVEHGLLRDLPFNLQGLSSSSLQFQPPSSLQLPQNLPTPIISLLHSLAEPCLLYKGLSAFVESTEGGLVNQSLRAAIASELRSYLGLVATLEAEIRQALAAIGDATEPTGVRKGGVTLKRCMVWTRDATMALRLMSLIVEEARGK